MTQTQNNDRSKLIRRSPEFETWRSMVARCTNPKYSGYANYGGRGISVCKRWLVGDGNRHGFIYFIVDMGLRPEGCTINRINNDGNYEPSNCEWATLADQRSNRRKERLYRRRNSACRLIGVYADSDRRRWRARITINQHCIFIGNYSTAIEAALARDDFVVQRGLERTLNFPERHRLIASAI